MDNQKSSATLIWVLAIFFSWLSSLIFYLTKKEDPFLHAQSKLALNLSLNFLIIAVIINVLGSVVTSLAGILSIVLLVVWVGWVVLCIMQLNASKTGETKALVPAIMIIK